MVAGESYGGDGGSGLAFVCVCVCPHLLIELKKMAVEYERRLIMVNTSFRK